MQAVDQLINKPVREVLPGVLATLVQNLLQDPVEYKPNDPRLKIRALILSANRESAQAVDYQLQSYLRNTSLRSILVDGTLQKASQFSALRNKTDILISTPAYLPNFVEKEAVNLAHIQVFVVVGLDEMLKNGYQESLEKFLVRMPWERQNIAISETLAGEVAYFAYSFLKIERPSDLVAPERPSRFRDRGDRPDRGGRRDSRGPRDRRPPRENRGFRGPRSEQALEAAPEYAPRSGGPRKDGQNRRSRSGGPAPLRDNNRSSYKNRHHQDRYLDAFSGEDKILDKPPVDYKTRPQRHMDLATSEPVEKKKGLLGALNPLKWLGKKSKATETHKPQHPQRKHYSSRPRQDQRRPR